MIMRAISLSLMRAQASSGQNRAGLIERKEEENLWPALLTAVRADPKYNINNRKER